MPTGFEQVIHEPRTPRPPATDTRKHTLSIGRTFGNANLSEASRGELDAGSAVELRVTRQAGVSDAVVLEVCEREVAVECREQVLRRHAVTGLIEHDLHELVRPDKQASVARQSIAASSVCGQTRSAHVWSP